MHRAPRRRLAALRALSRGARTGLLLWLAVAGGAVADPLRPVLSAAYEAPTTRYAHGVLGDAVEWGALRLRLGSCGDCPRKLPGDVVIRLPASRVFEDLAPRVVALPEQAGGAAVVVESDVTRGARLALYTEKGLLAATPFIGRANRWLAPVGAADLDGDGYLELAYIDRPHLAKTLRIWRLQDGTLREVASLEGLTNHRIGWDYIAGGLRDCGTGPEMIVASADWSQLMSVRFQGTLTATELSPYSADAMTRALNCD